MNSFVYKLISALAVFGMLVSLNVCSASLLTLDLNAPAIEVSWIDCDLPHLATSSAPDKSPAKPKRVLDSPSGEQSSMSGGGVSASSSSGGPVGLMADSGWSPDPFSTRFVQFYKRFLPPLVIALDFKIPIA